MSELTGVLKDQSGLNKFNVTMSNKLIRASHTLSLVEKRCIAGVIAKIDSRRGSLSHSHLAGFTKIKLTALEYSETYGIDLRIAYRDLKKAADNLFDRRVTYKELDKHGTEIITKFRWLSSVSYAEKQGYVELSFTPDIHPHLNALGREFKQYKLKNASSFKSVYTWRIFEYTNSWLDYCVKKDSPVSITVDNLRVMLDAPKSYTYKDLRVRALEPALKEINKYSNLHISFEPIKKGRSVHSISFYVKLRRLVDLEPAKEKLVVDVEPSQNIEKEIVINN